MKAIFVVCERIGDGKSPETAWRPSFSWQTHGWNGTAVDNYFVGNVFDSEQTILDTIATDPRTEVSFPIDVNGTELSYNDPWEIPPQMRGKIISWCAQTYGVEFGQWVAANAKNRRFVAQEIMRKACGVPDADPLNGFRIHWTE